MNTLQQNVSLPNSKEALAAWLKSALSIAESTERLIKFGEWFANRGAYDNRLYAKDDEGYNTGERVEGLFFEGNPTRRILWQGSEDERAKGMFFDDRKEDDGTEFTVVRPFTESIVLREGLPLPGEGNLRLANGIYTDSSPAEMSYQRFVEALHLGPLALVFAVKSHQGECGAYFFPMTWGQQENLYFVVEINARYGGISYTFFQGDPEVRCALRTRGPRPHEANAYFAQRRSGGDGSWGAKECPHIIPITYKAEASSWVNPQPIELRHILQANNTLKEWLDETGMSPYLNNGGA